MKRLKLKTKSNNDLYAFRRIAVPKMPRLAIGAVIAILVLWSVVNAQAIYEKSVESEESYVALSYSHSGRYSYNATLIPNTLYNKTTLYPGQGLFFKSLLVRFNPTFSYSFYSNRSASVVGEYMLSAKIQTDLWTKS